MIDIDPLRTPQIKLLGTNRVYASADLVHVITSGSADGRHEFFFLVSAYMTGESTITGEPFKITLYPAILEAARTQNVRVRLYRTKMKARGRGRRFGRRRLKATGAEVLA